MTIIIRTTSHIFTVLLFINVNDCDINYQEMLLKNCYCVQLDNDSITNTMFNHHTESILPLTIKMSDNKEL